MKQILNRTKSLLLLAILPYFLLAQYSIQLQPSELPNWRPYNQDGINVFEPQKNLNTGDFTRGIRFGAGFTQQFQSLNHENASGAAALYPRLASGFSIAQANLYMDAVLAEGITLNVTTYLSARHHNEAWVKGGYIQVDKLPFKGMFWDKLMNKMTFKLGHMEINYGDQHFRRSDGGHTLYNPFIENYIMDAFATEVAGEAYYHAGPFLGMLGVSNGLINGGYQKSYLLTQTGVDSSKYLKRNPSVYAKLAWQNHITDHIQARIGLSGYFNKHDGRSTLYGGDRTGSNYFFVLEPANATSKDNAFSGRYNPSFTNEIRAIQLNAFVKAYGFELFGTFENAAGRTNREIYVTKADARSANQIGIDLVYRFCKNENFFVGARYNSVSGKLIAENQDKQKIDRIALGAGWLVTKSIMLKGEYVQQKYTDFPKANIYDGGKFNGVTVEAVVGF